MTTNITTRNTGRCRAGAFYSVVLQVMAYHTDTVKTHNTAVNTTTLDFNYI